MRSLCGLIPAAALIALCSFPSTLQASIVYNVNFNLSSVVAGAPAITMTGTITTDGTLGYLNPTETGYPSYRENIGEINAINLTIVTSAGTFYLTQVNDLFVNDEGLFATTTNLSLGGPSGGDVGGEDDSHTFEFFFSNGQNSDAFDFDFISTDTCVYCNYSAPATTTVLGQVAAAVVATPEPAAFGFLLLAGLLGISYRKFSR